MTDEEVMNYIMETKKDNVNHPKHYITNVPIIKITCECGKVLEIPVECIDVIRNMPAWKGSAIKYLWREGLKTEEGMTDKEKEIEDLNKAIWYIKDRINQLKNS